MSKSCAYTFDGDDGKPVTITGMAEFKAYLASGGLSTFYPEGKRPQFETKPASKMSAKIEDSGEVLEGARKLYAKSYAAKLDEGKGMDLAAVPLSKSWPEPDYQRLIDEGTDPWAVALARAVRDEVPTKPMKSWKLKGWVEKVEGLRGMAQRVMNGSLTRERFTEEAAKFRLNDWFNKIDLYEAVGHTNSLKGMVFTKGEYSFYAGQKFSPPKVLWTINIPSTSASATWRNGNWGNDVAVADTKEEAIEKFKAWTAEQAAKEDSPTAPKSKRTEFDVYSYRNNPKMFIVGKRVSSTKSIDLKEFETAKDAREFIKDNQDQLEQMLADAKTEPAERREENAPRVGSDHRDGADVTTDQFREAFGFRGEQFGASMPQDERQANMNRAYDALMDLAGVIGVPPKALSLTGELGLAFGARGTGGKRPAAAHYEPDTTGEVTPNRVVINLTRKNGAGSLAHEWFHAVDNYFARMRGEKAGFLTQSYSAKREGVRPEMVDAFKQLMNTIAVSGVRERSKNLDKKRTKDYWSTGLEMAARSFESYIIAKLQDQSGSNDYLANIVPESMWQMQESYPYPTMGELPAIRTAFDNFFATVQTKETDKGVAVYEPQASYASENEGFTTAPTINQNTGAYETDLFGEPLRTATSRTGAARSAAPRLRGNPQPSSSVYDTPAPSGDYFVKTTIGSEVDRKMGTDKVLNAGDLATATSYLYKSAVERFDGVVTDKDGQVLAVVGGFKGAIASTAIYPPTLMAEAIRIPGASHIWFSHNHPTGQSDLSSADQRLWDVLDNAFKGTGIEPMGLIAVGNDEYSYTGQAAYAPIGIAGKERVQIPKPKGEFSIAVMERSLPVVQQELPPPMNSPAVAMAEAKTMFERAGRRPGMIMLNTRNQPVGWLPLGGLLGKNLRDTGGMNMLFRAASESNMVAAILVHDGDLDVKIKQGDDTTFTVGQNIGAALNLVDIRVLDILKAKSQTYSDGTKGVYFESAAENGVQTARGPVFSRSQPTKEAYESRIDALFAGAKADRIGATVLDRSDVLDALGFGDKPVVLSERKVLDSQENHREMTAQVWKRVPDWIENPAAVFKSDTKGGLVFIAPELIGGKPVSVIVVPDKDGRNSLNVHLLLNAYSRSSATPFGRWLSSGLLRFVDKKKFPALFQSVAGRQLPSTAIQNKPGTLKILTEKDLAGYRKEKLGNPNTAMPPVSGMSPTAAQAIVDEVQAKWDNAPEVIVVESMDDPQVPQSARDDDAQARKSQQNVGDPEGFFLDGKVYLVSSALNTRGAVMRVMFHESLGHFGLHGTFGAKLTPILRQIVALRRSEVAAKAEQYGLDMNKEADRLQAAEEVLAEMAQSKPEIGFVQRAIAIIRGVLRRLGMDMKLTDDDIIGQYILPARAFVERGKGTANGKATFSRGNKDQTKTSEFKKWFGDSKVVDADGKPLKVYHGTIVRPTKDGATMGDIAEFDRMFTTKFRAPSIDMIGSWFSTNPGDGGAEMYSGQGQGSAIYPVYLSIKNPQVTTFQLMQRRARLLANGKDDGRMIRQPEVDAYRKWLEATGKDGIKIEGSGNDGSTEFDNQIAWIALEPGQIKSAIGNNGDFDGNNPDIRLSRGDKAQGYLDALSQSDDLFALPKSNKTTIAEIVKDNDLRLQIKEGKPTANETSYTLTLPDGTTARITVRKSGPNSVYGSSVDAENNYNFESGRAGENPGDVDPYTEDVWLDVSNLKAGHNGTVLYNIASTFAHNTGRIFIGDPNGLSDAAMRRRSENMLSSALKFGTTKHLAPHPRQTVGGAGVPPLKWVYGDDVGNIERLIDLNLKALDNANPDAKRLSYDLDTGTFSDARTGRQISRAELVANASDPRGRSRASEISQAGWRTTARGAVFRAILGRVGTQGKGEGRTGRGRSSLADLVLLREKLASPTERERIFYSRVGVADLANKVRDELGKTFTHEGKLSWWHKTIGSQYNLAERNPAYKRVFDAAQNFINDVSYYGTEAANMAPKLLPKLETIKDLTKTAIPFADNKAVAAPVFQGTLSWTRDADGKPVRIEDLEKTYASLTFEQKARMLRRKNAISEAQLKNWKASPLDIYESAVQNKFEATFLKAGLVWSDAELRRMFNLTPEQIALYEEFRAATNTSLDNMAKAQMLREGGKDVMGMKEAVMDAPDIDTAAMMVREFLLDLAKGDADRADMLTDAANSALESAAKVNELKKQGYAPLSRFGRFTVDVVVDGERQYFGLYETERDANNAAAKMRMEFGAANVEQGTMSQKEFELFQGITPESLELFGNMMGLNSTGNEAQDKAFQSYLKLTKNNRSAMKRLIHRKGVAGYSEDVGRVLASFVYSNARQTSAALHIGEMDEAITEIPKGQGELKDHALELAKYVKEPQEEAAGLRGMMFAQYLGGSIASAMVNFTQPLTVSIPYLSQFGGLAKAGQAWAKAVSDMTKGVKLEAGLANALKAAEESGIVSPQEVHQLMAQARGAAVLRGGDGTRAGDARAMASNGFTRATLAWGKLFGYAEQINRRSTFIAAYRLAVENKNVNPAAFAEKAVNETQFINNKANKMKYGRGAIGATLMTFKSYSLNWLELMHRLSTQNGKEGKLAAAYMLGALFLVAGAGGLPFAEDVEDLIDGIAQKAGYNFSSKKAKQEFLEGLFGKAGADFVNRGVSGIAGVPIDLSGRLGMANLIPSTGLLLEKRDHTRDAAEILGPVGDMAKRGFDAIGYLASGEVGRAAESVSPRAVSNAIKGADMADKGMYRDAKGAKVIDTSAGEAFGKAIGFQPSSVAQVQEANYLNQRAKDFFTLRAQDIRSKWAQGIFENDPDKVQEARQMLVDWNEDNPNQRMTANMPSIVKRVREMRKDKAQRIADTAPKSMRAQMRQDLREAQMN